eukprot:COSAG06_NODE_3850_length_4832_cov_3.273822_1_plen_72_part_00
MIVVVFLRKVWTKNGAVFRTANNSMREYRVRDLVCSGVRTHLTQGVTQHIAREVRPGEDERQCVLQRVTRR